MRWLHERTESECELSLYWAVRVHDPMCRIRNGCHGRRQERGESRFVAPRELDGELVLLAVDCQDDEHPSRLTRCVLIDAPALRNFNLRCVHCATHWQSTKQLLAE